jgi:hypothetical protein
MTLRIPRSTRSRCKSRVVQCLGCNHVYEKPSSGHILDENPGCPSCGYLGWAEWSPTARSTHCFYRG